MKSLKLIPIILIVLSVALTACRQRRTFEPAPIITTTRKVTERQTVAMSEFKVFGTQMGMSIEQVQKIIGENAGLLLSENGQCYFAIEKDNLEFVNKGVKSTVYFIFDLYANLCEIQYETSEGTGFNLEQAIKRFDGLYGRHVKSESGENDNYIWYSKGDYILITLASNGKDAITYFGEDYFKQNYPEEYKAFNKKGA